MEEIKQRIKASRKIKDNSLNLYLHNVKKLSPNGELKSVEFLKETKDIMEKLKEMPLTTQRSYLTSIIVVLCGYPKQYEDELEFYRLELAKLNEEYNKIMSSNKKSEKQEKNWVKLADLLKINNKLRLEVKRREIAKKEKINNSDFQLLQRYLVSSLYTLQPPVRLDFANMKIIRDIKDDDDETNFIYVKGRNSKFFIFNDFKNVSSKGKQRQKVNPKLNKVLNLWLKHNTSNNFLIGKGGKPVSPNSLGKMITRIFDIKDKKITLNLIRHIYVSEHIDLEQKKKEAQIAESMMHSNDMQTEYAKT